MHTALPQLCLHTTCPRSLSRQFPSIYFPYFLSAKSVNGGTGRALGNRWPEVMARRWQKRQTRARATHAYTHVHPRTLTHVRSESAGPPDSWVWSFPFHFLPFKARRLFPIHVHLHTDFNFPVLFFFFLMINQEKEKKGVHLLLWFAEGPRPQEEHSAPSATPHPPLQPPGHVQLVPTGRSRNSISFEIRQPLKKPGPLCWIG